LLMIISWGRLQWKSRKAYVETRNLWFYFFADDNILRSLTVEVSKHEIFCNRGKSGSPAQKCHWKTGTTLGYQHLEPSCAIDVRQRSLKWCLKQVFLLMTVNRNPRVENSSQEASR
jgi:hypothetical protein